MTPLHVGWTFASLVLALVLSATEARQLFLARQVQGNAIPPATHLGAASPQQAYNQVGTPAPLPSPPPPLATDNLAKKPQRVACGTIVSNLTSVYLQNPHHPRPTYSKLICELVIERADPSVSRLVVRFKHLDLYRSNMDGQCLHDRFGVFTDLNAPMTPILCGNQTGKSVSVPFLPAQGCLIVSVITSDLDHDRSWTIEIEQEK